MSNKDQVIDNKNQKFCSYCGKPFEYNKFKSNRRFCNKECREAYYGIQDKKGTFVMKECLFCKKVFKCSGSTPNKLYCSDECAQAFYKNKNKIVESNEITEEKRQCAYCGEYFAWKSSTPNKKYCSAECSIMAAKEKSKKIHRTEKRNCEFCGKEFEWSSLKPSQKYCGKECLNAATLIKIKNYKKDSNENTINLKSVVYLKVSEIIGKMNQSEGDTFGNKYIDYWQIGDISEKTRDEVLKRDGYECQICKRKDSLHLHHLIKRKNGGKHNSENLITLCASCHRHIETGDIEHATNKCLKNAKRYYNSDVDNDTIDFYDIKLKLIALFNKLKDSSDETNTEILIQLDDIIDLIDSQLN